MKMKLDDIDCVSAIIGTSLTNIKLFFHFSICPLFGSFALIYVYKWLLHLFALWQLLCELHELRVTWIALSCLGCIDDVGKIESCCCESQLVTLRRSAATGPFSDIRKRSGPFPDIRKRSGPFSDKLSQLIGGAGKTTFFGGFLPIFLSCSLLFHR